MHFLKRYLDSLRLVLAVLALSLLLGSPAQAIVINDTAGPSTAISLGTPHSAVVEIFIGGSFCTGTLIDATSILTAQHCTFGASLPSMSVHFHHLNNDGVSDAVYGVAGKAEVNGSNVLLDGTDLAILTLNSTAPVGVSPVPLALYNPVGVVAETVGFGYNGVGSSGHGFGADGLRWAAENVIDTYGAALNPPGSSGTVGNIFNTDFDDGSPGNNTLSGAGSDVTPLTNEGTTAPGDSGGPLLVDGQIAGVLSGGTTFDSVYGDISWWTGTLAHAAFIQANAPGAIFGSGTPDTPSNASFSDSIDQDVLNIDFGFVAYNSAEGPVDFDITNLPIGGSIAPLDLLSIAGSGDTATLTTDLAPFADLLSGFSNSFSAMIDSSTLGDFSATYDLSFTDELGTDQTLTLNLSGLVSTDDPTIPDLVYDAATGDVYLDPRDAGAIMGYVLQSDGDFNPANFTPVLGGVSTSTVNELSEANLSAITTPMGIGAVMAPGLSLDDVYDTLTNRDVSTALGQPVVTFDVVMACALGDADCDGDVDISGDILPAFSNFTGPGSFGAARSAGDVEAHPFGDGDVDVTDILLMFGEFTGPLDGTGLLAPAAAGDPAIPDLIYDPVTGEVILDADGASIIGYSLKSAGGFLAGGHTPILGGVATSLASELAEAALSSSDGSIGFVFPVGLDLAGLLALLTENTVSTGLGAPLVPFDLVVLGPAVPEPATFLMAVVGLLGLTTIACRRTRRAVV